MYSDHSRIDTFTGSEKDKDPIPFITMECTRKRLSSPQHEVRATRTGTPYFTTTYLNYLERDLVITTRDGNKILVAPQGRYNGEEIIVCKNAHMPRVAMQRALDNLRNRPNPNDKETHYWIRAYESALQDHRGSFLVASIEYVVSYHEFVDSGGHLYMNDLDITIEWAGQEGIIHPFDKINRDEATINSIHSGVGESSFVFVIKAVDNAPHVTRGTRYVNLGGEIYTVPIERDKRYETGIHVITRAPVNEDSDNTVRPKTYSFEQADKLYGLYKTIEDAQAGGPITDMAKSLIEKENVTKRLRETEIRSDQLDIELELQRLRNEASLNKAKADHIQSKRRDWLDWLKTGVAAIGSILGLYAIIMKFKKS